MVGDFKLYGLIGNPLGHSFSPGYFNKIFQEENINARYELWQLDSINDLPNLLNEYPEIRGFNVTIPYKREVMKFLDFVDPVAIKAGAVNTVKVNKTGNQILLEGCNTDVSGFKAALSGFMGNELKETSASGKPLKCLILGTGGASGAVATALDECGIYHLFVSRSKPAGKSSGKRVITYSELTPDLIFDHKLIVNTTPVGMYPDEMKTPPFPWEYISPHHYFFDLIYNPETTLAMRIVRSHGANVSNGLGMLYAQADAARKIWHI